jgi:hypothetical protein
LGISLEHLFSRRISDGHDRLSLSACSTLSSKSFLANGSKLKRQDQNRWSVASGQWSENNWQLVTDN